MVPMKKITQPAKIWSLITGFLLFTIIFSTASTSGISDHVVTIQGQDDVLCPADNNGSITITVSGGTGSFTYEWRKDGEVYPTSETTTLNNLSPGDYEVFVTDTSDDSIATSGIITIKATDAEAPEIFATNINLPADTGECFTIIDFTDLAYKPTATDNCSVGDPTGTRSDGQPLTNPYPVGETKITWNVTDANGNAATPVEQLITITDDQIPVITTSDINLECAQALDFSNAPYAPVLTDNCGTKIPSGTRSDGLKIDDPFPYGTTTITWNVQDVNKNDAAPIDQQVTITDDEDPIVITQNITIQLDASGVASISPADVDNGTTDNCSLTLSLDKDTFDCSEIGIQPVVLTATDGNNNTASATAEVTVEDNLAPLITADDIAVPTDVGQCFATVTMTASAQDNCLSTTLTGVRSDSLDISETYPVGNTQITWTATDAQGNEADPVIQNITVTDSEIPVIAQPTNIEEDNTPGTCEGVLNIEPPTVYENCGVATVFPVRNDGKDITDPYPVGTTIITWNAQDVNDNWAKTVVQEIKINDVEPPTPPTLPDIKTSCEITLLPPTTATDNCTDSADIKVTTSDPLTYKPQNSISEHVINWTFEDAAGNLSTTTQHLTINPLFISSSSTSITCNNSNDGNITITANGGEPPYTYALDNGSFGSTNSFDGLSSGTYIAKVKDQTGCIFPEEIEILQPDPIQYTPPSNNITTSTTAESCFGAQDGEITIKGDLTGGNGEYVFLIGNQIYTSNPIKGLPAGFYEIYVQDTNGCNLSQYFEATVDGPDILDAKVNLTQISCYQGQTGAITVSEPTGGNNTNYSFRINNGPWQTKSTPTGYQFTGLSKGTYTVDMKDSKGCLRTLGTYTLTDPDEILPKATATRTTTYGSATGTATANPTGGDGAYKFLWENSAGTVIGNTKSISGLMAGTYRVTVTDGNLCTGTQQIEVFDQITTQISAISLCENTTDSIRTSTFAVDLDKTMGGDGESYKFTYEWDFGEGASLPAGTTGMGPYKVNYASTGDKVITLTITDLSGVKFVYTSNHYVGGCFEECDSANNFSGHKDSFYIGDAEGNKMITSQCDQSEPMYLWFIVDKSSNGYILSSEFVYTVTSGSTTRQYSETNCFSNEDGSQLKLNQLVRLNEIGPDDGQIHWSCDEVLNIIHITYRWTSSAGKLCGETQRNHCASTNETMSVAAPIRGGANATGTCSGEKNGSIIVEAYGGTNDFNYKAVNDETGEEFSSNINVLNGLPGGTYTVTITDNKEVVDTEEVTQVKNYFVIENVVVEEAEFPITAKIRKQDISCYDAKDGWAEVYEPDGGTPFVDENGTEYYKYLWNDLAGQTTAKAENLGEGPYTVTITDSVGCSLLLMSATINEPDELTTANAGPDQKRCGFTTTTLEANTPVSGSGKWTISPNSQGKSATIGDVYNANSTFTADTGEYTLVWTITGSNGCSNSDEVKITIIEDCNYLDFDGVDDYVDMGNHYNFDSGPYSLEAWVKPQTISGTTTIISKRNGSSTDGYELVITSAGYPGFKIGSYIITPEKSLPINSRRWYHIAVTYDGAAITMYVDGLEVRKVTEFIRPLMPAKPVINPSPTSASFLIGATYDDSGSILTKPNSHFNGWIEEVRLWKKSLTQEQIQFMMNQRLEKKDTIIGNVEVLGAIKGTALPLLVPGNLKWDDLAGYYQLLSLEASVGDGTTKDRSNTPVPGVLKNITTLQENTAPLPYISQRDGNWRDIETSSTPWKYGRGIWDAPNSLGVNQKPIDWNIVRTSHNIISGNSNIKVLGLLSDANEISVFDPNFSQDEYNPGHSVTVTHYLKLNGSIDLNGESQLLQDEGSILEESSSGYIERDQQGTASSYNYNYWSSPVSLTGSANNSGYTVAGVLKDGTDPTNPKDLSFEYQYHWADGDYTGQTRISTYWLFKYTNFQSNTYAEWLHVGATGSIKAGEGFTMKGTSGSASIADRQNFTFIGKPNNGTIKHVVNKGNDYLVGNPYPSAIDSEKFILDNLKELGGHNSKNVFNGTLYFWDHFAGKTHYLKKYIGGYATLNLSGGIQAIANDERINATGQRADSTLNPKRYIPVGQAFYVSTQLNEALSGVTSVEGGEITFKNSQRVFETEHQIYDESTFKSRKGKEGEEKQADKDKRAKIYLRYISPEGFQRQILVTKDTITSFGFDLGYDAPLIEDIDEDMYWSIHDIGFVIQGVPNFDAESELPLTVKVHEEGEFSIAIDQLKNVPADLEIHLKDSLSETTHDLRKSAFKTTEAEGLIEGRFSLVFPSFDVKEELPKEGEIESINSYYSSKEAKVTIENPLLIPIKSAILYNINGQKLSVFREVPLQKLSEINIGQRASGVYILKLQMEDQSKSIKFVVE